LDPTPAAHRFVQSALRGGHPNLGNGSRYCGAGKRFNYCPSRNPLARIARSPRRNRRRERKARIAPLLMLLIRHIEHRMAAAASISSIQTINLPTNANAAYFGAF
jgi:hypothetical protein